MEGKTIAVLCLLAISCKAVLGQIECKDKPDGSYGYGCRSYTQCAGGKGVIVDCAADEAYDYQKGKCQPIKDVPLPCGSQDNDCAVKRDGRFPLLPDCIYYYTCLDGHYLGANPCNNPPTSGLLVFDEEAQLCNWRASVKAPCGTAAP